MTLAVPCEDRAAINNKQILYNVLNISHPNCHQLQIIYRILSRLYIIKELNETS